MSFNQVSFQQWFSFRLSNGFLKSRMIVVVLIEYMYSMNRSRKLRGEGGQSLESD